MRWLLHKKADAAATNKSVRSRCTPMQDPFLHHKECLRAQNALMELHLRGALDHASVPAACSRTASPRLFPVYTQGKTAAEIAKTSSMVTAITEAAAAAAEVAAAVAADRAAKRADKAASGAGGDVSARRSKVRKPSPSYRAALLQVGLT